MKNTNLFNLRIKDRQGFGGIAVFALLIAMIATMAAIIHYIHAPSLDAIGVLATGQQDQILLNADPVQLTYNWCAVIALFAMCFVILGAVILYFIGTFDPQTAARVKSLLPTLILAAAFAPAIGYIIKGCVEINHQLCSSYISTVFPTLGWSAETPAAAITNWFHQHLGGYIGWGYVFPAIGFAIIGLEFGILFMLYLRTALIAFLFMFSPIIIILTILPQTKQFATKLLTMLVEAIFLLLFFNMALTVVATIIGSSASFGLTGWGGDLLAVVAGMIFLVVVWKWMLNPIGPALSGAMMAGAGGAFLALSGGMGVAGRVGRLGGKGAAGLWDRLKRKKGKTEKGKGAPRSIEKADRSGSGEEPLSEKLFAAADRTWDDALTPRSFADAIGDIPKQLGALGMGAAGFAALGIEKFYPRMKDAYGKGKIRYGQWKATRAARADMLQKGARDIGKASSFKEWKKKDKAAALVYKNRVNADFKNQDAAARAGEKEKAVRENMHAENPEVLNTEEFNRRNDLIREYGARPHFSDEDAKELAGYNQRIAAGEELSGRAKARFEKLNCREKEIGELRGLNRRYDNTIDAERSIEEERADIGRRMQEKIAKNDEREFKRNLNMTKKDAEKAKKARGEY